MDWGKWNGVAWAKHVWDITQKKHLSLNFTAKDITWTSIRG